MTRTSLLCIPQGAGCEDLQSGPSSMTPLSPVPPRSIWGAPACLPSWLTPLTHFLDSAPSYPAFAQTVWTLVLGNTGWRQFAASCKWSCPDVGGWRHSAYECRGRDSFCIGRGGVLDWTRGPPGDSQPVVLWARDLHTLGRPLLLSFGFLHKVDAHLSIHSIGI